MLKRILPLLLAALMLLSSAGAETVLDPTSNRNISILPSGSNPVVDGVSPVTGRNLMDLALSAPDGFTGQAVSGRYMPMLVQIDNAGGGVTSKTAGMRAPWGVEYADVVYEAPLYKQGYTRLTFLFSDLIPDDVGPIRSARLFHAWLREEWDCGLAYYGQQEYTATNVPEVFSSTGATQKGVLFNGIVGDSKVWKQYYYRREKLADPHDVGVNAAALSTLIPEDHVATDHAWRFTDETPTGGDIANVIHVTWGVNEDNSILEYDEDDRAYYRYMLVEAQPILYKDLDSGAAIAFDNVIVQFTSMDWVMTDAPKPTVTGSGNADYFMGGQHFSGVWNRDSLSSPTIFYGEDGNEIELQRGRTLIIVMDTGVSARSVSYSE